MRFSVRLEEVQLGTLKMRDMKMQEWKQREKKSMTQDTEVEVARVNRGMRERTLLKPLQEKEQPTQRGPNKSVHLSL